MPKMFVLLGETPATGAKTDAATVMRIETALAKASLTRVEQRDPYKLYHKMTLAQTCRQLTPGFDWTTYFADRRLAGASTAVNVDRARVLQGA